MNAQKLHSAKNCFPISAVVAQMEQELKRGPGEDNRWFNTNPVLIRALLKWLLHQTEAPPGRESADAQATIASEKPILIDPFMGFGTILKEAIQAGFDPIGIDINPVAWFFSKVELAAVELKTFNQAIRRLARQTTWHNQPLAKELHHYYQTECPCPHPHLEKAEILRMFWMQTAICSNPVCQKRIPLFEDFIILQKKMTVPYYAKTECPACNQRFDWDQEPVTFIAAPNLMVNGRSDAAGVGRALEKWSAGKSPIHCPWCHRDIESVQPTQPPAMKKVLLTVLICPYCHEVWQYRGALPENVRCPTCHSSFYPRQGNLPEIDWYLCPFCGTSDKISDSYLQLKSQQPLPVIPYAIEGYCPTCHKKPPQNEYCVLHKNGGHFFKKVTQNDLSHFLSICQLWTQQQEKLDFPLSKIIPGKETVPLLQQHYFYWFQLFNRRQLLSLATLLQAIRQETNQACQNLLLKAFLHTLEFNNNISIYHRKRHKNQGIFDNKQFSIPYGYAENNVYGLPVGDNSFIHHLNQIKSQLKSRASNQSLQKKNAADKNDLTPHLWCSSIRTLTSQEFLPPAQIILTEVPTDTDSRFLEWSDFYYAWLRLVFKEKYSFFLPEHVFRIENLSNQDRRRKNKSFYFNQLKSCLEQCARQLRPKGLMLLLLPYQEQQFWEVFIEMIFRASLTIEFIYPIPDRPNSGNQQNWQFVFGCKSLSSSRKPPRAKWENLIDTLHDTVQAQIKKVQAGYYGANSLPASAVRFILAGRAFNQVSRYFQLLQDEPHSISLAQISQLIYMIIDWELHPEHNLPDFLKKVDPISYLYLAYFCVQPELSTSTLNTLCEGICPPEVLTNSGLLVSYRRKTDRFYQLNDPLKRYERLKKKYLYVWQYIGVQINLFNFSEPVKKIFRNSLVDILHLLMGMAFYGENIQKCFSQVSYSPAQIRAVCEFLKPRQSTYVGLIDNLLQQVERIETT